MSATIEDDWFACSHINIMGFNKRNLLAVKAMVEMMEPFAEGLKENWNVNFISEGHDYPEHFSYEICRNGERGFCEYYEPVVKFAIGLGLVAYAPRKGGSYFMFRSNRVLEYCPWHPSSRSKYATDKKE